MELRHILEILWRRKWIAINVFLAIFLTIVITSLIITPWYDATAKILVRKSSASSTMLSSIGLQAGSQTTTISDTDREDYRALATVSPVVNRALSELRVTKLRTRARLINVIPFLKPALRIIGVNVDATEKVMTAEDLTDSSILRYILPRPYVEVNQNEESDVFEIKAISPDPVQAMKIANKMAEAFIQEELERVRDDYKGVKNFIDLNIEKTRREYTNALESIKRFRETEKTVNLDTETNNIIQRISDLNKTITDNNLAIFKTRNSVKEALSQLKSIPKFQKSSEQIKDNEVISSLKLTLRDLYLSLAETKTKYTKDHPAVIDIENKITQAKELMAKEMEKVYGGETIGIDPVYQDIAVKLPQYYTDIAGYEAQNQALPIIIKKYESEMLELPRKMSEYAQLQLTATVTQDIYNSMLKYQYQLGMAESLSLSSIYLVEPAITPEITSRKHKHPTLLLNTIIAIFIGCMFGIGTALLAENMDDTLRSANDIKAFTSLTFLGSIFRLRKIESRLISEVEPRSPLRESFRTIRNSIRFANPDKTLKSIVVTSSVQAEGKSFLATNLAISVANDGKKVLLIDGDMRRPSIHDYFKLQNTAGLSNYLVGDSDSKQVQIATDINGLNVILTGPIPPDPAKLVESKKMSQLIKEMEDIYDLVVIDTPPLLPASDAIIFGRSTGGIVVVVESGKASRRHISDIIELCKQADLNIIGAVLNKTHGTQGSYYYYYHYKY